MIASSRRVGDVDTAAALHPRVYPFLASPRLRLPALESPSRMNARRESRVAHETIITEITDYTRRGPSITPAAL